MVHSLRVAEEAERLAPRLGADPRRARLAGLVHDVAKELPPGELSHLCRLAGLDTVSPEDGPDLLHAPVGAWLLESWGLSDAKVLEAVRCHTTGCPGMGAEALAVYVADLVEPGRSFPGVTRLRRLAEQDPAEAFLAGLEGSVRTLLRARRVIHPATLATYNWAVQTGVGGRLPVREGKGKG